MKPTQARKPLAVNAPPLMTVALAVSAFEPMFRVNVGAGSVAVANEAMIQNRGSDPYLSACFRGRPY
jgi:hypothetical protein